MVGVGTGLLEAPGHLAERLPDRGQDDRHLVLATGDGDRHHRLDQGADDGPLGAHRAVQGGLPAP